MPRFSAFLAKWLHWNIMKKANTDIYRGFCVRRFNFTENNKIIVKKRNINLIVLRIQHKKF